MKSLFLVLSLLCALDQPARCADEIAPITCEGAYPLHLQGVATDGREAIFWSWTDALVKTDLRGRLLKRVAADNHQATSAFTQAKFSWR